MASSVRVSTSIDIGGGEGGRVEPDLKRRRLLDAGGPVEDDETARQKMRDAKVYERGVDGTWGVSMLDSTPTMLRVSRAAK